LFQMRINAKPISANVTGWFGRWRSRRTISSKHAQWVKDRVKLLAMVTHQHFMSDSHALLAQHVVERCPAEIWRCWPELGWTEWHKAEQHHLIPIAYTGRANILFTDESRFHLGQQWWPFSCVQPCRRTICRRLRHSTSIVWWWQCYGVGRHSSTWQNTIGCCRRKSDRYTLSGWDDVVQPYVIPFINTATTKRLTLNDADVCISFSYTAVHTRTVITAVLGEIGIHL
jgi:hypothetical protein